MSFNIIIYLLYFIMCLCVGTIYTIDIYNSGKSWGWPIIIHLLPSIVFAPFILINWLKITYESAYMDEGYKNEH